LQQHPGRLAATHDPTTQLTSDSSASSSSSEGSPEAPASPSQPAQSQQALPSAPQPQASPPPQRRAASNRDSGWRSPLAWLTGNSSGSKGSSGRGKRGGKGSEKKGISPLRLLLNGLMLFALLRLWPLGGGRGLFGLGGEPEIVVVTVPFSEFVRRGGCGWGWLCLLVDVGWRAAGGGVAHLTHEPLSLPTQAPLSCTHDISAPRRRVKRGSGRPGR
jgi:hypothetical protein